MNIPAHNEDTRFLELLQKWQSGEFTRSDEQELNRLAASDAFRQEALDGFWAYPDQDHAQTLDTLRNRLQGKQKARRFALPQILAIAAALTLVIGAIWFFNVRPVPTIDIVAVQEPTPTQDTSIPSTPTPDELPYHTQSLPHPSTTLGKGGDFAANSPEKDLAVSSNPPAASAPNYGRAEQAEAAPMDIAAAEDKLMEAEAPAGSIEQRSTNIEPVAEKAKRSASFTKKKMDAAKPVPAYDDKQADKASKSAPESSAPVGGWDAFRAYLKNNARLTPEALANNISGTVRLQFRLDASNQPIDFQIIKSLGFGCDEEAVRLVKTYSWQRNNNAPVTVDVPFVR